MGCTQSSAADALLEYQRRLQEMELKNHEQQNLLRFKVEVLVNMLSVEEKKTELNTKRIDTLKWLLYSQGVTEEALTSIVSKFETGDADVRSSADKRQLLQSAKLIDLAGALTRMRDEFEIYKEEIVRAFATDEGKLIPSLPAEEFMKQIYTVTENVSKADLCVVSLRFDDGFGSINVPEFLDFFATPLEVRTAKAAANAVRMSLDLLELDVELLEAQQLFDEDLADHEGSESFGLDRGAKRLLLMWTFVNEGLEKALVIFREQVDEKIVKKELFERTMLEICGKYSSVLNALVIEGKLRLHVPPVGTAQTQAQARKQLEAKLPETKDPQNEKPDTRTNAKDAPADEKTKAPVVPTLEPLDQTDIALVTERFELDGSVHYGHFMAFFRDLHARMVARKSSHEFARLPEALLGTSPFRQSTEWRVIRDSTLRRSQSEMKRFTAPKKIDAAPKAENQKPPPVVKKGETGQQPKPDPGADAKSAGTSGDKDAKPEDKSNKQTESKDKPEDSKPPARSMWSFLLCGGNGGAAKSNAPSDAPQAKDDKPSGDADDKQREDKSRSASEDSQDSESALAIKKDSGFTTPKLKPSTRKVTLPPEDPPRPAAELQLHRDPLGDGDKKPAGSRFRRRTGGDASPVADSDLAQIRKIRGRLEEDEEMEDSGPAQGRK